MREEDEEENAVANVDDERASSEGKRRKDKDLIRGFRAKEERRAKNETMDRDDDRVFAGNEEEESKIP